MPLSDQPFAQPWYHSSRQNQDENATQPARMGMGWTLDTSAARGRSEVGSYDDVLVSTQRADLAVRNDSTPARALFSAVEQSYNSAPERQLMRAASREDRAHTQVRSRAATTGRNTLKRTFAKAEEEALATLGGAMEPEYVKKLCAAAGTGKLAGDEWRV